MFKYLFTMILHIKFRLLNWNFVVLDCLVPFLVTEPLLNLLGFQFSLTAIICHFVMMVHIQMCEQAAEAHKSKGVFQSSRRRHSSDPAQPRRSSIDAILDNSNSVLSSQVYIVC